MRRILFGVIGLLVLAWIGFSLFSFTVDETQKAVVLEFGKIKRIVTDPGLYFKTPFVQNVVYVEDRLLSMDIKPAEIITVDKQRLTIDSYTLWRIADLQKFVQTVPGGRTQAETNLDNIVYGLLRDVLGKKNFTDVLQRDFLTEVKQSAQTQVADFGIQIVDVRIKRADLPDANAQAVYQRMISERKQIAQRFRAEGEQESQRIRSDADRQVTIIKADASKTSEELKGEGDAQALETYANAYNQDEKFFLFWRTLESYKKTLETNTTLVLSSQADYLRLLETMQPQGSSNSK
ncbi:protease modulator HflC [Candidatus Acetothermia bacterium]|nr:protease modulator HflC [Candidatus Acetothermia bacterium]MBI3643860.1 protease modulator HflC [Candidatus Acetothermia bacterium]